MNRLAILAYLLMFWVSSDAQNYVFIEGEVFHTSYHITYQGKENYHDSIKGLFQEIDNSLSMFNKESILSQINNNDTSVRMNQHVRTVLDRGMAISKQTDGAFDMTVAPLVNLWGFGYKHSENITKSMVDSILSFVGYEKIKIGKDGQLKKGDNRIILDASSIAKGYACDVVGEWLAKKGITNYIVEIGGEITLHGYNPKGKPWHIGINTPEEDSLSINREPQDVLLLTQGGVATSGNYRKFYYKDGKKYAHTIDPHTGYPVQQDILSSTVIATDCMTADAYATAFMVIGSKQALRLLEKEKSLMAYFILSSPNTPKGYRVIYSPSLKKKLREAKESTTNSVSSESGK